MSGHTYVRVRHKGRMYAFLSSEKKEFSFGENGENCLDGAITVTGYLCVNSNLLQGK